MSRYTLLKIEEIKPYIIPEKWDEFVSFLTSRNIEVSGVDGVAKDVIECFCKSFSITVEDFWSKSTRREVTDPKHAVTHILHNIGFKPEWMIRNFGISKATIDYRRGQFKNLYDTNPFFNRNCQAAMHELHLKGYAAVRF